MGLLVEIGPGLDAGVGRACIAGAVTVDACADVCPDHVCRWGDDPLPFGDRSCALIYASHVLEHLPLPSARDALRDARRCLAVGGRLELWVPDFAVLARAWRDGMPADQWMPGCHVMEWVNGRLFCYEHAVTGQHNLHRSCWDRPFLRAELLAAGFSDVQSLLRPRGYDHGAINLGVAGVV